MTEKILPVDMANMRKIIGYRLKALVHSVSLGVCTIILGCSMVFAAPPGDSGKNCVGLSPEILIDHAWGGVRDKFDAVEDKRFIYIGYYDSERWLSIVQINKCTGEQKKVRMPSRFEGWDAHNYITLALDNGNRLHVAGNMHASPLVYSRMSEPDDLTGLDALQPMVGSDESQATYPSFFRFADGTLGFSYRSGRSGDGVELINRLEGNHWIRWTNVPVFAPGSKKDTVNAYPTDFVFGPDGYFHVAWVWRANPNVETNFNVNYAKSRDLRVWKDSLGRVLELPITPETGEVVDPVSQGQGLLNNIRLGFDGAGRPVISYLKFDKSGATQLFHARREKNGWNLVAASEWTYRWELKGRGTIRSEISFSGVSMNEGHLLERVHQPEIGTKTFEYGDSLKISRVLAADAWADTPALKQRRVPTGTVLNARPVREGSAGTPSSLRAISWLSLPSDNRDRPRKCEPTGSKCDFAFDLILNSMSPSAGGAN
jgi:hypothetical protein